MVNQPRTTLLGGARMRASKDESCWGLRLRTRPAVTASSCFRNAAMDKKKALRGVPELRISAAKQVRCCAQARRRCALAVM